MSSQYERCLKLVVAGEGGVGKTALIETFQAGKFKKDTTMTIAVQFHVIKVKSLNQEITLQIWDLGGQRHYYDMNIFRKYCDEAQAAMICFDVSDLSTLEEIPRWTGLLPPDIPKILIGTKNDLVNEEKSILDVVEAYLEDFDFINYVSTSAKSDPNSIKKVFEDLMLAVVLSNNFQITPNPTE